jgi:tRNA 2-thiouridine synthesizing protein A
MTTATKELDARGLNCPLPILRAKKSMNELAPGEVLRIVATDPGSVKDFEAFSKQTGNALLESGEENGEFFFLLKKGGN